MTRVILVVALMAAITSLAHADVLWEETFDGETLDLSKWRVNSGEVDLVAGWAIIDVPDYITGNSVEDPPVFIPQDMEQPDGFAINVEFAAKFLVDRTVGIGLTRFDGTAEFDNWGGLGAACRLGLLPNSYPFAIVVGDYTQVQVYNILLYNDHTEFYINGQQAFDPPWLGRVERWDTPYYAYIHSREGSGEAEIDYIRIKNDKDINSPVPPGRPATCYDVINDPNDIQMPTDLNGDCYVDSYDLSVFTSTWMDCDDPQNPSCD